MGHGPTKHTTTETNNNQKKKKRHTEAARCEVEPSCHYLTARIMGRKERGDSSVGGGKLN